MEDDIKTNRKDRRVVRAIQARVKRQNDKILGRYKERIEELQDATKLDWSLFNMVMERIDFRECKNSLESLHKLYSSLWTYLAKLIRDNYNLRAVMAKHCFDEDGECTLNLSEADKAIIEELFSTEGDPLVVCRQALEEVRKAAAQRVALKLKQGLYLPETPKIIT